MKRVQWTVLGALWVLAALAGYYLASVVIDINPRIEGDHGQLIIAGSELVVLAWASIAVIVLFPSMTEWELRRPRPRLRALLETILALALTVAAVIPFGLKVRELQGGPPYPQWELVFNNTCLYAAIAFIAVTLLGQLRGLAASIVVYIVFDLVLAYRPEGSTFFWPVATFTGAGPWKDISNIVFTGLVVVVALWMRYHWAGAANSALNRDN